MEYDFIRLISENIKQLKEFPLPALIADASLDVCWSNSVMQRAYPRLTQTDGLRFALAEFDVPSLLSQAFIERGNCTIESALPFSDTRISLTPVTAGQELAGVIAIIISHSSASAGLTERHVGHTALALSDSVRRGIDGIFSAADAAYLKAAILDATPWLSPHLNRISTNAYQILRLAANISEYAKFQGDAVILKLSSENIFDWLREIGPAVSSLGENLDIPVRFHVPEDDLYIRMDLERFELAFYNILYNSLFYTRAGNHIEVAARKGARFVTIKITDHGQGMMPEVSAQAFKPYFSFPNRDGERGIGLGLTIAQRIIHEHGGQIKIRSRLEQGTSVTIALPAKSFSQALPLRQGKPDYGLGDRFSNLHVGLQGIRQYDKA
ncbi:MAG: ATP-binding protein [Oscillospiraceae bacterium]|jgi:signal transduction histidine kinase|nr:ATP-binding protein [Oscillospiraceae bacterium]